MSRRGNCWDNACAESFFHSLKTELFEEGPPLSRTEMKSRLFEYMKIDYSQARMHSALDYQIPLEFELKHAA
ncbi:MAG: IS3 family transposase [Shewanella sp.]